MLMAEPGQGVLCGGSNGYRRKASGWTPAFLPEGHTAGGAGRLRHGLRLGRWRPRPLRALQGWACHTKPLPAGLRPSVGSRPWSYQEGPTAHSPPHTGACLLLGSVFQEAVPRPLGRGQLRPLPAELSPPTGVFAFSRLLLQTVSSLKWRHCVSTALVSQLDVDQSLSRLNLCAM